MIKATILVVLFFYFMDLILCCLYCKARKEHDRINFDRKVVDKMAFLKDIRKSRKIG